MLGEGAVADLCVWKNKITSSITLVMATLIWYLLEIMEIPLVPFLCSILLLLMLLLFFWAKFGQLIFTRRFPTPEEFKKEDSPVRTFFRKIEGLLLMLYKIAYGKDIKTFLWTILYVAIIYTIGSYISLPTILYICLVCSMTIPVLYLQFQAVIGNFIGKVSNVKNKILEVLKSDLLKIFGQEAVVDLCVWKNKIRSAITLVMATLVWYLLEIMEIPFVPFLCSILLLLMLLLFIWAKFRRFLLMKPPTPEEIKRQNSPVRALFSKIKGLLLMMYKIAYGEDIKAFLWTILCVAIIYTIGSYANLLTVLYICLVCVMTIPVLYLRLRVKYRGGNSLPPHVPAALPRRGRGGDGVVTFPKRHTVCGNCKGFWRRCSQILQTRV